MRNRKLVTCLVLVMGVMVVPARLGAQTTRIAIINTQQVIGESAIGKAVGTDFRAYATEQQQPLLDLEAEINVKAQQLETQRLALSPSALQERTTELDRLQRNYTRGQEDLNSNLQAKQAEILEPVFELANSVIEDYAAEEGLQMIVDPSAVEGLVVFLDPSLDVTQEVIRRMDEAYAAQGSGAATSPPPATTAPAGTNP